VGGASAQVKSSQPACPQLPLQPAGGAVEPVLLVELLALVEEELLALVVELLALVAEDPPPPVLVEEPLLGAPPVPVEVLGAPPACVADPPSPVEPGGFDAQPMKRPSARMRATRSVPTSFVARILPVRCSSIGGRCGSAPTDTWHRARARAGCGPGIVAAAAEKTERFRGER
jgi:hypothetical protein